MKLGKTIRLYLLEGTASGPIQAEVINWTGQVFVIPRSDLSHVATQKDIQRTGVYLLVGRSPKHGYLDRVYVGEGDDVYKRLKAHETDPKKEFWDRAIAITSKDSNLTKAHVRYLEHRLVTILKEAGRVECANGNEPSEKELPMSDVADMEYFLEQIKIILPAVGCDALQSKPEELVNSPATEQSPLFEMSDVGTLAQAREIDGSFVVLKGSTARKQGTKSWDSYVDLRDQLIEDGSLIEKNEDYFEFTRNTAFKSLSAAAAVIAARNTNGRLAWKLQSNGQTYADWKENHG
jgi:hypothetical protein